MAGCQCNECYIRAGATPAERVARRREVASGKRADESIAIDKRLESLIPPARNQSQSAGG